MDEIDKYAAKFGLMRYQAARIILNYGFLYESVESATANANRQGNT